MSSPSGATCTADAGVFRNLAPANSFAGCTLEYDGVNTGVFPAGSFTAVDFTASFQNRIEINVSIISEGCNLLVRLCDSGSCDAESATLASGLQTFLYTDFALDFTDIVAVQINLTANAAVDAECTIGQLVTVPVELESFSID